MKKHGSRVQSAQPRNPVHSRSRSGRPYIKTLLKLSLPQILRILHSLSDAFIIFDNSGRYVYLNKKAHKVIGIKSFDGIGKHITEVFPYASGHPAYVVFQKALKTKKFQEYTYYSQVAKRWFQTLYYPTNDGIAVLYIDVHDSMVEKEMHKFEEYRYRRIIEIAPDLVYSLDTHGIIVSLSPSFKHLTGWSSKKWIGRAFTEIIHPDDIKKAIQKNKEGLVTVIEPFELRILTRWGTYKTGEFRCGPFMENRTVIGSIGIARDISERLELSQELQMNFNQQSALSELGLLALKNVHLEKLFQRAVQKLTEVLDLEYSTILELTTEDQPFVIKVHHGWVPPNQRIKIVDPGVELQAQYTLLSKKPVIVSDITSETRFNGGVFSKRYRVRSGMSVIIHGLKSPYGVLSVHSTHKRKFSKLDTNFLQSVANILGMAIQRRVSERETQAREKQFRTIIEKSSDGFRLVDKHGNVLYVSPSIKKMLGYTQEEYIKLDLFHQLHPDDIQKYQDLFDRILQSPNKALRLVYRMKHKNGSWRWFEGIGRNLLHDPSVGAIVSNFRDITDWLHVEQKLRESRDRFRQAVSVAQLGMWYWNIETQAITINRKAREHLGLPVQGKITPALFQKHIDPEDYKQITNLLQNSKNMSQKFDIFFRTISQKDKRKKWIQAFGEVYHRDSGEPYHFDGVTIDVTGTKEMDQQKNEFITMASHELKTPITSLKLFVDMLARQLNTDDPHQLSKFVVGIRDQADNLRDLINDMLDVSRIESGKLNIRKVVFPVDELIENTLAGLEGVSLRHKIIFKKAESMNVYADRFRMYQVLTNLITNAIKYSPQGERIIVSLRRKNNFAVVSVKDYGIGVPKHHHKKLFDKLYQVTEGKQESHTGLGMGLYISKEIVRQHKGTIRVQSTPGKGSTFFVSLPIHDTV